MKLLKKYWTEIYLYWNKMLVGTKINIFTQLRLNVSKMKKLFSLLTDKLKDEWKGPTMVLIINWNSVIYRETVEKKVIQIHTGEISVKKSDVEIPISKKSYLPLALYFIEQAHNFTQSALWQKNDDTDQATEEHVETNWNLSS